MASKSGALPLSPSIGKEEKEGRKKLNAFQTDEFHANGNFVDEDDDDDDKAQEEEGTDDERNGQFCDVREAVDDNYAEAKGTEIRMPQNNDESRGNREDVTERNDNNNNDDNDNPVFCRPCRPILNAKASTASAFALLGLQQQTPSLPRSKKATKQNDVSRSASEPERRSTRLNDKAPSRRPCYYLCACLGDGYIPDGQPGHIPNNRNEFKHFLNVICCDKCYEALQKEARREARREEEKNWHWPICNNANCGRKLSSAHHAKVRDPVTHEFIPGKFMCPDGRGCRNLKQ
jgi:hypothetical protein